MRVITGMARGARLKTLDGEATRPSLGKVKEAVFSVIQFEIEGTRFLDLYAGSGQMGIEALSRGAERAVFVDNSKAAVECIRQNLEKVRMTAQASAIVCDAGEYINKSCKSGEKFDIIYIDPPYGTGLVLQTLTAMSRHRITHEGSVIFCETDGREILEGSGVNWLDLIKTYSYGQNIKIYMYRTKI